MSINKLKVKVAVEGNIGCGKTTFLKYFEGISQNIEISPEPIELWNNVKGFKLFEVFYGDQKKWGTPFESQILVTFFNREAKEQTAPVLLLERSIHSCRNCFIEALNINGQISDMDLKVFDMYYEWGLNLPICHLDLIVYLRSSPEVCAERIKKRNRPGEKNISMDYLSQLHDLHEEWLWGGKLERIKVPVMVFDCNEPLEELQNSYFQRRDQILGGVNI